MVEFQNSVKTDRAVAPDGSVSVGIGTVARDDAYVIKPGETHRVSARISTVNQER